MFPTRTRSIQVAVREGVELMTRVRVQLITPDAFFTLRNRKVRDVRPRPGG